jgi:hypothetical protein
MTKLKRTSSKIPSADSAEPFVCECCNRLHLVLLDENDKPIATFGYDDEVWLRLIDHLTLLIKERSPCQ